MCVALGVTALATASACNSETKPVEQTRRTSQAQLQEYVLSLPGTANLGQHALVAAGRLRIEDRVQVQNQNGGLASVANAGSQTTTLGALSQVQDIISHGSVELRNDATVFGDLTTSGTLQVQGGAQVLGTSNPGAPGLIPSVQEPFTVDFGGISQGDVHVDPPSGPGEGVRSLSPGRYGRVTIKSGNRLELSSGTYHFDEFSLEPQTRIVLNDAAAPVYVNIRDQFHYKSRIESATGGHPAIRIAYVGSNSITLETIFRGTLMAPHASVRLASSHPELRHVGAFFAKDIEVSPDVVIEFRPYWSYQVETTWVTSGAPGRLGESAVTDQGEVLTNSLTNVVRSDSNGQVANEFPTDQRRKIVLGNGSTGFGYFTETTFVRLRPDGSQVGAYTAAGDAVARLVPATHKTVIASGDTSQRRDGFFAFDIYDGSAVTHLSTERALSFRVGQNHVVYSTGTETVCLSLSGAELWRKSFDLLDMTIAENADQLVGAYNDAGAQLVHIDLSTGTQSGPVALSGAPFAVEISPNGTQSLVALKDRLVVFEHAAQKRQLALPMARFSSADILDSGEIVIGGANAQDQSLLAVFGPETGMGSWVSDPLFADVGAYRPFVEFYNASTDFIAVTRTGLTSYSVKRSL